MKPDRRTCGWRLSSEVMDRLRAAAAERDLPDQYVAERLIAEGLDRLIPADELRFARPPTTTTVIPRESLL